MADAQMALSRYRSLPADQHVMRALCLAKVGHAGQVDKAGLAYIEHPVAVSLLVRRDPEWVAMNENDQPLPVIAALLHDVVEDTPLTLEDLRRLGFPEPAVDAVDLLTRRPEVAEEVYYAQIKDSPIALMVKRADIKHNTDPRRMARLDPRRQATLTAKYKRALEALS